MKKFFSLASICLFGLSQLRAETIETDHFKEILNYIGPETLIILDIDDTLLIPVQTLGTDVWFQYRLKQFKDQETDAYMALDRALAEWEAVRHITKVKIVEEGTDKIIETMQNNHSVIMGLTTQGLALATRTVHQLQSINIDLAKTAPFEEDLYFMNPIGVLYRKGILFTSGTAKGPALTKFIDSVGMQPKRVVFINDKKTHLHDVEKSIEERGIEFIGLRYNYCDEKVARFDPSITEVQRMYSTFDHLLSDEEAEAIFSQLSNHSAKLESLAKPSS